jgi:hypothetical protein
MLSHRARRDFFISGLLSNPMSQPLVLVVVALMILCVIGYFYTLAH